jgi:hypothetical protein
VRKNPGFSAIVRPPNEFKSKKSDDLGWPDLRLDFGVIRSADGRDCQLVPILHAGL